MAGAALLDGLRRPARVACDDREPRRRGLQQHDAEALDVEAAAAGAARQGEHVADGVVSRHLSRRHGSGEHDVLVHPDLPGQPPQPVAAGAVADEEHPRSRDPLANQWKRPDERVLPLARHQPGHAHDERRVADAVAPAQLGARCRVGPEPLGVDARGHHLQRRPRTERCRDPGAGVAGDRGQHVGVGADPAQRLAPARQHRPAHLVAVRAADHALDAGTPAQVRTEQRQRRRRAEPDGRGAVLAGQCRGAGGDRRDREHERRRVPVHREGRGRVELRGPWPGRRVDGELVGRQPLGEGVQVGLDAAGAGREVVGHEERARHCPTLSVRRSRRSGGGQSVQRLAGRRPFPGERTRSGRYRRRAPVSGRLEMSEYLTTSPVCGALIILLSPT